MSIRDESVWYEPFMGSGVVGLNLAPKHAVFADTNPYVIALYNQIKIGHINSYRVREYLEKEGRRLAEKGEEHYYYIRDRFIHVLHPNYHNNPHVFRYKEDHNK